MHMQWAAIILEVAEDTIAASVMAFALIRWLAGNR